MNCSGEFAKILREVFSLDPKWVDWFMRDVYKEEDLRMSYIESRPAAVLLTSPYQMDFHGQPLQCNYISCVATVPQHRGKGLMRGLMSEALTEGWVNGVPFAALIPASRPLYFLYDHLGFATVFYVDEERYTALHEFDKGDFESVEHDYDMFRKLEDSRICSVRHTEQQYIDAVKDMELSGGFVTAVIKGNSEGMAFVQVDDEIKVVDLLATDKEAAEAALANVRERAGQKPVIVSAVPDDESQSLRVRGMLRIVNVQKVLEKVAKLLHDKKMCIRIQDSLIPQNAGTYLIKNGKCEKIDESTVRPDLDVTIDVLAKILFSEERIGELFDIPTHRPFISLMLD